MKTLGKNIGKIAILLWIPTILFIAYTFYFGFTKPAQDTQTDARIIVRLNENEKAMVLGEMRHLLQTLQNVMSEVENENYEKASQYASSAGMAMAVDVNPAFMAKLPVAFKKLGMSVHEGFDQWAVELKTKPNDRKVISQVSALMQKCVACHASYKFPSGAEVISSPASFNSSFKNLDNYALKDYLKIK